MNFIYIIIICCKIHDKSLPLTEAYSDGHDVKIFVHCMSYANSTY